MALGKVLLFKHKFLPPFPTAIISTHSLNCVYIRFPSDSEFDVVTLLEQDIQQSLYSCSRAHNNDDGSICICM